MDLSPNKPVSQLTDEALIEQYRAGRDEAFSLLVGRYKQELYHFLFRFVGNQASAEDVFQDAFLQVHQSLDTFETSRRFKPWLFTIAANKARDHLRRSKRRATVSLSGLIGGGTGGTGGAGGAGGGGSAGSGQDERSYLDLMQGDLPLPDEQAARHETEQQVAQVVAAMPEHLRQILLLAYFHQFPYKQIADMLQIPLGTVKSRLHSAIGTFGKMWKAQDTPL